VALTVLTAFSGERLHTGTVKCVTGKVLSTCSLIETRAWQTMQLCKPHAVKSSCL